MRRIILAILCCLLLAVPVSAASRISDLQSTTTVSSDGTCRITVTVVLQLEEKPDKLVFPLPAQAKDVTLNGTIARAPLSDGRRNVNLSGIISGPGMHTFTIQYFMPDSVTAVEEDLTLTVELLSGFAYPVEKVSFSILLPGAAEQQPRFYSSYLQENVATAMTVKMEENVISGTVTERLQDRESLIMTLPVTETLFPQSVSKKLALDYSAIAMGVLTLAAVVYWLVTMGCLPPRRMRTAQPPAGITAGELGMNLTDQGVDLTMMVISWAQMGYILIQPDDNGRILLHKRMDMGNERSQYENRLFKSLFGRRKTIEGTGYRYAQLCIRTRQDRPGRRSRFQANSGNPRLVRILAAAVSAIGGLSLAASFSADTFWQVLLAILLIPVGAVSAWLLQEALQRVHLRDKLFAWLCVPVWALWLLLCLLAQRWDLALFIGLLQLLTGLAAAYGGRRTETGKQDMAEILGLRRYLKKLTPAQLQQNQLSNPNYYYDMAPYALALGINRAFTKHFDKHRLPECSYLTTGMDGHLTAREWDRLLRSTVDALDALQRRLPLDRLLGR